MSPRPRHQPSLPRSAALHALVATVTVFALALIAAPAHAVTINEWFTEGVVKLGYQETDTDINPYLFRLEINDFDSELLDSGKPNERYDQAGPSVSFQTSPSIYSTLEYGSTSSYLEPRDPAANPDERKYTSFGVLDSRAIAKAQISFKLPSFVEYTLPGANTVYKRKVTSAQIGFSFVRLADKADPANRFVVSAKGTKALEMCFGKSSLPNFNCTNELNLLGRSLNNVGELAEDKFGTSRLADISAAPLLSSEYKLRSGAPALPTAANPWLFVDFSVTPLLQVEPIAFSWEVLAGPGGRSGVLLDEIVLIIDTGVPEPGTIALIAAALIGMAVSSRRKAAGHGAQDHPAG